MYSDRYHAEQEATDEAWGDSAAEDPFGPSTASSHTAADLEVSRRPSGYMVHVGSIRDDKTASESDAAVIRKSWRAGFSTLLIFSLIITITN